MIGMMYLVLTAMLALNVSKEVLDAFVLVDNGLKITTEAFAAKNEASYSRFAFLNEENEEKVGMWMNRADEVRARTDGLYNFIQECKLDIIREKDEDAIVDGEIDWEKVDVKDNLERGAAVMISEDGGRRYKELKQMLDETREYMLSTIEDKEKYSSTVEAIENNLNTNPPDKLSHSRKKSETLTWQSGYFEDLPLAAVITLLSKMQADVRNVEAEMINYLLSQVDAGSIPVNSIEAVVIPERSLVFPGQQYRARVFLAAYDSTKMPEVKLSDGTMLPVEQGKGIYTATSNTIGIRRWAGTIQLEHEGRIYSQPFDAEYEVAEANATISATAMNVFYRGIPNPVAISAGGVAESTVQARISSPHSIRRIRAGEYEVKPGTQGDKAIVSVYTQVDGSSKLMTQAEFRVRDIPDPDARVSGIKGSEGVLSVGQLAGLDIVRAEAEDFLFEVDFKVTEFEIGFTDANGKYVVEQAKGNAFTDKQKAIFRSMRSGQIISISQVKAIGPDGKVRSLNPINIRVR
jgi:gliding motility-associated protein GldM